MIITSWRHGAEHDLRLAYSVVLPCICILCGWRRQDIIGQYTDLLTGPCRTWSCTEVDPTKWLLPAQLKGRGQDSRSSSTDLACFGEIARMAAGMRFELVTQRCTEHQVSQATLAHEQYAIRTASRRTKCRRRPPRQRLAMLSCSCYPRVSRVVLPVAQPIFSRHCGKVPEVRPTRSKRVSSAGNCQ